jgi:hypothetical protein
LELPFDYQRRLFEVASHPLRFISNSLSDSAERGTVRLRNLLLESSALSFLSACFTYVFIHS